MGFLTNLTKTTIDIATTPIDIVKDTVTMGGVLIDEEEPSTIKKLKEIVKDIDKLSESTKDGII